MKRRAVIWFLIALAGGLVWAYSYRYLDGLSPVTSDVIAGLVLLAPPIAAAGVLAEIQRGRLLTGLLWGVFLAPLGLVLAVLVCNQVCDYHVDVLALRLPTDPSFKRVWLSERSGDLAAICFVKLAWTWLFAPVTASYLIGEPLPQRVQAQAAPTLKSLRVTRMDRKLSIEEVAKQFKVEPATYASWEESLRPGGGAGGHSIPLEMQPFLLRWIETGDPPAASEIDLARKKGV